MGQIGASTLETILKRDRIIVLSGVVGAAALAWVYLAVVAVGMSDAAAMARIRPWGAVDFALMFLMWAVMMVGMMLPSAAPMILLFAAINRKQREQGGPFIPTGAFGAGYVIAWTGFSMLATALQWALEQAALLSPMMVSASPVVGGLVLVAAGVYQWTPLKHACLKRCRSPFEFISRSWRRGAGGALAMGLEHGAFCVGCCWVLMGLLFVGGVMNLLWVAAIAVFVLIEKLAPFGALAGRASGLILIFAGLFVIVRGG